MSENTCGKCRYGDYFRCGGEEPVGMRYIEGSGLVAQVLCRYNMGLTLGPLLETSTCRQNPPAFQPRPHPFSMKAAQKQPAA